MYALRNKVQLIGHVGQNPEVKTFNGGKKVAKVGIATSDSYRNASGEKVTETQWHNLVVWGKLAEIMEKYVSKGSELAVEGKLIYRTYNDKEGVKKNVTEILVNELLLLGEKSSK